MGVDDVRLRDFIAAVAAPTPTPGGGSVAALVAALSVALARMVAGLARDRKGYEAEKADLERLETRAAEIQSRLEGLVKEDAAAYETVLTASRRPRGTDEERASRVEAMQSAYRRAAEVPLETMRLGVEALELASLAAEKGSRSATTDAGVAILLAEAAIRSAALNVRVNLASIRDGPFRDRSDREVADLLESAQSVGHRAMGLVEGRL